MTPKAQPFYMILLVVAVFSCKYVELIENSDGIFSGNITSNAGEPIYPVYILEGDSLLGIVNEDNSFIIQLNYGHHEITFSAFGYSDKITFATIDGNYNSEIILEKNNETGRIYGELQDLIKYQEKIAQNNGSVKWTEQEIFDGVTSATILEDNSNTNFKQAQIFIGDSLLTYADIYGQYWIKLQCGTYPLTGKSTGFSTETKAIKVIPNSKVYLNFFLNKN